MIKTFAGKHTQSLFVSGRSRRLPPEIVRRALRKLEQMDAATSLNDLRVPPSNRLHPLAGDREGQHSVSVNDQWRICFAFKDGDAYDVEVRDYH
nr:plasmid maintenance system killer protein [uncultured bacterium]